MLGHSLSLPGGTTHIPTMAWLHLLTTCIWQILEKLFINLFFQHLGQNGGIKSLRKKHLEWCEVIRTGADNALSIIIVLAGPMAPVSVDHMWESVGRGEGTFLTIYLLICSYWLLHDGIHATLNPATWVEDPTYSTCFPLTHKHLTSLLLFKMRLILGKTFYLTVVLGSKMRER